MREEQKNHIPEQVEGGSSDSKDGVDLDSIPAAVEFFHMTRRRLLAINGWQQLTGDKLSQFQLADANGKLVNERAREGLYIRIDIPGPGTRAGQGYDWVQIHAIEEDGDDAAAQQAITMTVHPSAEPNGKRGTAHFFDDDASSTFRVSRDGLRVTAAVHGRNEKANHHGHSLWDRIRNFFVGNMAKAGLASIQWTEFVKGLVKR